MDTQHEDTIYKTVNGPFGHVAYVEKVNIDGSILISEMNWIGRISHQEPSTSEFHHIISSIKLIMTSIKSDQFAVYNW